jgi:hypothetical protein
VVVDGAWVDEEDLTQIRVTKDLMNWRRSHLQDEIQVRAV